MSQTLDQNGKPFLPGETIGFNLDGKRTGRVVQVYKTTVQVEYTNPSGRPAVDWMRADWCWHGEGK